MAFAKDNPLSFKAALELAEKILSSNPMLVRQQLVATEAEQIILAAYRRSTGKVLKRLELFARNGDRYPERAGHQVIILATARAEGKPLQHLIGYQTFLDHEYDVGPDVLVPRPETEELVIGAECMIREVFNNGPALGLEIGLGSGAISIELLAQFSTLEMLASELTEAARSRAARNAKKILGGTGDRLRILAAADPLAVWEPFAAAGVRGDAQFLISNPPYLAKSDPIDEEVLTHEPASSLFAPEVDLLHFYRQIAGRAREFLIPGGLIFVEIPPERASGIYDLFHRAGLNPKISKDLNGRDRVIGARVKS